MRGDCSGPQRGSRGAPQGSIGDETPLRHRITCRTFMYADSRFQFMDSVMLPLT